MEFCNKNVITLTLTLMAIFSSSVVLAAVHQYQIDIDEKIEQAKVVACFDGKVPEYLSVAEQYASQDLLKFPHSGQGKIEIQGRYWLTSGLSDNACLDYVVSLKRHHAKRSRQSAKRKNIAYLEDNTWLWLPETINEKDNVQLNFNLPKGVAISAPWQLIENTKQQFLIGSQPQEWGYTLLIGDFKATQVILNGGQKLNIATTTTILEPQKIIQWLTDTGNALGKYLGKYPVEQTQIIVIAKSKGGPVPWGDVSRGNGFGIRFVVVPKNNIESFYQDWTATHEFSHQLLPKLQYQDSWLSEGLSSYLQYVLMAQSKIISKETAWEKLYLGFERGEQGTQKSSREPLSKTSTNRRHGGGSGRTMRIYWSGALYFLQADLALRQQSNGKVGLDDILLKLNHCCINSNKVWTGLELAEQLDQLAEGEIFTPLYQSFSSAFTFPDYRKTYSELGIKIKTVKKSNDKQQRQFKLTEDSISQRIFISK